jgi:pantoate--beta-alanine ligase
MLDIIEAEELAKADYVSIAHPETLEELERVQGKALVSLAVRIGRTRLIDNITLGE